MLLGANTFAHEGIGSHSAKKHDDVAGYIFNAWRVGAILCSPPQKKTVRLMLKGTYQGNNNSCGSLCEAVIHAGEYELSKACESGLLIHD